MSNLLKLNPNFKPAFDGYKVAQELILKLTQSLPVHDAILFGSCVDNTNTLDSDLDILVIIPNNENVKKYYDFVNQPFSQK